MKIEKHGLFVALLGDRLMARYTDGGAGKTRNKRKARAAKLARKRNRR
jgi:hypothetical protein